MTKIIETHPNYTISPDGVVTNTSTGTILAQGINKQTGYKCVSLWKNNKGTTFTVHRLLAIYFIDNPEALPCVNHKDGVKTNNALDNLEWCTVSHNAIHAYSTGLKPSMQRLPNEVYQDILLNRLLKGESITSITASINTQITRVSKNLRKAAKSLNLEVEYDAELVRQKKLRNVTTGLSNRKLKVIEQLHIETSEVVAVYYSIAEAASAINCKSAGPISNCLAGRTKTAYGYKWRLGSSTTTETDGNLTD